jgi:hypothetical protein
MKQTPQELIAAELHLMKTSGIVEVAVRNQSVSEYMDHWEKRAETAEAALKESLAREVSLHAAQTYTYIGRDGKAVLARTLEDRAEAAENRETMLRGSLAALVSLNDNYSYFGGEMYQDRVGRTWDIARGVLEWKEKNYEQSTTSPSTEKGK